MPQLRVHTVLLLFGFAASTVSWSLSRNFNLSSAMTDLNISGFLFWGWAHLPTLQGNSSYYLNIIGFY